MTDRDKKLLLTLQAIKKSNIESVVTLRYVPVSNGHITQVFNNQNTHIHMIGSKLYGLLQELKEVCEVPTLYTVYYDPIGTLQVYTGSIVREPGGN